MATTNSDHPTITVSTPCTCNAKRWFYCTCSTIVAKYQCHRDLDGTGRVHPDDVAEVAKLHPGMDLIYF